jgi:predicted phosphodiesterase
VIPGGQRWIEHKSRKDELRLYWTADWHTWSKNCALELLKEDIQRIADDPMGFWLHGGDYAEFIGYQDKRFDPEAMAEHVKVAELARIGHAQAAFVRDLMLPIADKCIGVMEGNHEQKYMQRTQSRQLHSWLCEELGVPNLGYSTIFDLCFRRNSRSTKPGVLLAVSPNRRNLHTSRYRVFAHHGAGYAQTPGGKLNKLIQAMDYFPRADLVLLGHVHDQKAQRMPRLGANADCTELTAHDQVGAICGSYLRTYGEGAAGYGEQKLYRPVPLGMTVITFRPDKREMRVEI